MIEERFWAVLIAIAISIIFIYGAIREMKNGKQKILSPKAHATIYIISGCQWLYVTIFLLYGPTTYLD